MNISPINQVNISQNPQFEHKQAGKSGYSTKDRAIVATTSALGVAAACALLAKNAGYSLNPSKMFKNIQNSYLAKVIYEDKEVCTIGAGTCLGGLAGGYIIDKNPDNRRAKNREAVMQIGNISIPIITVVQFKKMGANFAKKIKGTAAEKTKFGKTAEGLAAVTGIFVGVYLANFLMNKVSNFIFQNKNNARNVKATDFSAHLDDMIVAANCISENKYIHKLARIIPAALTIPGYEVGTKTNHY